MNLAIEIVSVGKNRISNGISDGLAANTLITETEEPVVENEKNIDTEKQPGEEDVVDANKDSPANEP
uniref:Uncharacterized protein n=1 Tax=Manihot esculenta TaxID=3983 RepID=A0A2C9WIC9_MANES